MYSEGKSFDTISRLPTMFRLCICTMQLVFLKYIHSNTYTIALGKKAIATCSTTATLLLIALFCYSRSSFVASIRTSLVHFFPALLNNGKTRRFCPDTLSVCLVFMAYFYLKSKVLFFHKSKLMAELLLSHGRMQFINLHRDPKPES